MWPRILDGYKTMRWCALLAALASSILCACHQRLEADFSDCVVSVNAKMLTSQHYVFHDERPPFWQTLENLEMDQCMHVRGWNFRLSANDTCPDHRSAVCYR